MADFTIATRRYMSEPVITVLPDAKLVDAHKKLEEYGVSSLAVAENRELLGVISRTDLLRAGSHNKGSTALTFPDHAVKLTMTRDVVCVQPETELGLAAGLMVSNGFHRVFVTDEGKLSGVLSTRDVMAAIRAQREESIVGEHMSTPIFVCQAASRLEEAIELLERAGIGGLVVVEDEWPVGLFTQQEALRSSELSPNTKVEEVMNEAFVCVRVDARMHRAAARALRLQSRRVIVVKDSTAVGVLTGLDFARCAAR